MTPFRSACVAVLAAGFLAAAAAAVADPAPRAAAVQAVVDCRNIADNDQRLACYDKAAADIAAAEAKGDLISLDRNQRQAMRRQAFGLSLPTFSILDKGDRPEEANQLPGVVAQVRLDPYGHWIMKLQDGATWRQTDDAQLSRDPKAGSKVVIKKASLGSFMMDVDGQPAIRVHRDN